MADKKKILLEAEKRKISGRKVKKLRQEGILPANLYGKKIKSESLQLELKKFMPVFQEAGETGVVYLQLKGDKTDHPVLIHNVQLNPVTDQPLHADFYQVSLKEKVTAQIPVEMVGESVAVKEQNGVLIQPLLEVEVEALPTELPDKFEINISGLKEIDQAISVAELKVPQGVTILTDKTQILAKVEPQAKEEVAPPPAEEAPAEGEAPAEEAPEGEKPAAVEVPAGKPSSEAGEKTSTPPKEE